MSDYLPIPEFPDSLQLTSTIAEGRTWLDSNLDDGAPCPLCTQFSKVYDRSMASVTGRVLIEMYRQAGTDWCELPALGKQLNLGGRGDETKTRYWGLITPLPDAVRWDGSKRVGVWKLTSVGVLFVRNEITVPKYAKLYDGALIELHGEEISITDVLGTKFNFGELMGWV